MQVVDIFDNPEVVMSKFIQSLLERVLQVHVHVHAYVQIQLHLHKFPCTCIYMYMYCIYTNKCIHVSVYTCV